MLILFTTSSVSGLSTGGRTTCCFPVPQTSAIQWTLPVIHKCGKKFSTFRQPEIVHILFLFPGVRTDDKKEKLFLHFPEKRIERLRTDFATFWKEKFSKHDPEFSTLRRGVINRCGRRFGPLSTAGIPGSPFRKTLSALRLGCLCCPFIVSVCSVRVSVPSAPVASAYCACFITQATIRPAISR